MEMVAGQGTTCCRNLLLLGVTDIVGVGAAAAAAAHDTSFSARLGNRRGETVAGFPGILVDFPNAAGETALCMRPGTGISECRELLRAGADGQAVDNRGANAVHRARKRIRRSRGACSCSSCSTVRGETVERRSEAAAAGRAQRRRWWRYHRRRRIRFTWSRRHKLTTHTNTTTTISIPVNRADDTSQSANLTFGPPTLRGSPSTSLFRMPPAFSCQMGRAELTGRLIPPSGAEFPVSQRWVVLLRASGLLCRCLSLNRQNFDAEPPPKLTTTFGNKSEPRYGVLCLDYLIPLGS